MKISQALGTWICQQTKEEGSGMTDLRRNLSGETSGDIFRQCKIMQQLLRRARAKENVEYKAQVGRRGQKWTEKLSRLKGDKIDWKQNTVR